MRQSSRFVGMVSGLCLAGATSAQGAEGGTSLSLNLPALSYVSSNSKAKPDGGGDEVEAKTTGMKTQDLSQSYLTVGLDKVLFYFYPFNDAKLVSVSYMVTDLVEVGLDLGLNSMKLDKPKNEESTNTYGLFAFVYPSFGSLTGEFGLTLDATTTKTKVAAAAEGETATAETDSTSTLAKVTANVVVPVAKNVSYVGGLWYANTSEKDKEAKVKTTTGEFGVNIATIRVTVD